MSGRDLGASVRQRLLNQAHQRDRPFQELLQLFAMERFLYRLSRSRHAEQFVLKGALLLTAWKAPFSRPTMDIDLAGRTHNSLEHIATVMAEVGEEPCEDGIEFLARTVSASRIKEDAEYEGVRVRFEGTLARAGIRMQIDIGFGDLIVPPPQRLAYPALLDLPAPVIRAYAKETVIAEKLHAITTLGLWNSRIKDYFDIALLARMYPFDGAPLLESLRATFGHRGTVVEPAPAGLSDTYSSDAARGVQWRAFIRRNRLTDEHGDLAEIVAEVRKFAAPLLEAAATGRLFDAHWTASGPWNNR